MPKAHRPIGDPALFRPLTLAAGLALLAGAAQALPVTFQASGAPQVATGVFAAVDTVGFSLTFDDQLGLATPMGPYFTFADPPYGSSIAGSAGGSLVFADTRPVSAVGFLRDIGVDGGLPFGVTDGVYDLIQISAPPTALPVGASLQWGLIAIGAPGWLPDDLLAFDFGAPLPPGGKFFLLAQRILFSGNGEPPEIEGSVALFLAEGPAAAVPLPGAGALAGLGLGALGLLRRRATRRRPAP